MSKFLAAVALLLTVGVAYARDGYADRPMVCGMPKGPRLVQCQEWISTVQRPDIRGASCCGSGDSFIADDFEIIDGQLFAIISVDYPGVVSPAPDSLDDGSQAAPAYGVRKGQRILIPQEKVNHALEDANNTSGHGVVFLMPSTGDVLCYFFPPLV